MLRHGGSNPLGPTNFYGCVKTNVYGKTVTAENRDTVGSNPAHIHQFLWRGKPKGKAVVSKTTSRGRKAPWDIVIPSLRHSHGAVSLKARQTVGSRRVGAAMSREVSRPSRSAI